MAALLAAAAGAFWLGVLTSISPCPLATNIAALSFVARNVSRSGRAFASGLSYTVGRAIAYTALAAVALTGLLSTPGLSQFLQRYLNQALGPLLVLVGMALLDLLPWRFTTKAGSSELHARLGASGILGAFLLGILFALSLCPVSAALFFGSLLPLCAKVDSPVLLPLIYGVGTGLPVALAAALVAFGNEALGRALNRLATVERWARRITGGVFIAAGIYLTVRFVFLG
jgi:cytochrome c-type biogenesis protein